MSPLHTSTQNVAVYRVAEPSADAQTPSVYLDTSVVSYLTAPLSNDLRIAHRQQITRDWWTLYRFAYACCVSERVLEEAAKGNRTMAARRLDVLKPLRCLRSDERTNALARALIGPGLLPVNPYLDAEHVSLATVHSVRFLITWNCKHLANRRIARNVAQTCEAFGFTSPRICTPEVLMRALGYES